LRKEVPDDDEGVATKRSGLTKLTETVFKYIKSWFFKIIFDINTRCKQFKRYYKSVGFVDFAFLHFPKIRDMLEGALV
jgi:hypothetical protein